MASAIANLRAATSGNGNERFNQEALSWDSRPFVHEASREAANAIIGRIQKSSPPPKNVLEIGCGTGILSFLIAPHVDLVVAIDAAKGMIDVLQTKLSKEGAPKNIMPIAVLLEDPEDRTLPPANPAEADGPRMKFDLITSHLVLHHIPDLKAVLKTMLGCLAPGGKTMLTDFEDFGPEAKRFHPASKMGGVERHGINARSMAALMEEVGFANVDVRPAWTMRKIVEKFEGEFGEEGAPRADKDGKARTDMGEMMDFPFLLCYGEKPI